MLAKFEGLWPINDLLQVVLKNTSKKFRTTRDLGLTRSLRSKSKDKELAVEDGIVAATIQSSSSEPELSPFPLSCSFYHQ